MTPRPDRAIQIARFYGTDGTAMACSEKGLHLFTSFPLNNLNVYKPFTGGLQKSQVIE
jgi:hypothetical protein